MTSTGPGPTMAWGESSQVRIPARPKTDGLDTEDKLLKLREENMQLKKKLAEQEDRIRTLHTKYKKLTEDLKRKEVAGPVLSGKPDIEVQNLIADLQSEVHQYRKKCEKLELQLHSMGPAERQSLSASKRRPSSAHGTRGTQSVQKENTPIPPVVDDGQLQNLQSLVEMLRKQLAQADTTISDLKAENKALKGSSKSTTDQLSLLQMQREIRDKMAQLSLLQSKYDHCENSLTALKENHTHVLAQLDESNRQLTDERRRCIQLETRLKMADVKNERSRELEIIIEELKGDKRVLETENKRLLEVAFADSGKRVKERQMAEEREALVAQVSDLQTRFDALQRESMTAISAKRSKEDELAKVKEELSRVKGELSLLVDSSGLDMKDLEEVFSLLRRKREEGEARRLVDMLREEMSMGKRDHPDAHDLEVQNSDLAAEVNALQKQVDYLKMSLLQSEESKEQAVAEWRSRLANAESQLRETQQELSEARRIGKEQQMDDAHRATWMSGSSLLRSIKSEHDKRDLMSSGHHAGVLADGFPPSVLGDDENAMEFTVVGATFDPSALQMGDVEALLSFVTVDFLDFETVVSPVAGGTTPPFDFVSRYTFKVDPLFYKYVQSQALRITVYRTDGMDRPDAVLGTAFVSAKDVFLNASNVMKPRSIVAVILNGRGLEVGRLECIVRVAVPVQIPQSVAVSLRQQSSAAGGSSTLASLASLASSDNPVGYIQIHVVQVSGLPRPVRSYVAYEFFTFRPYETKPCRMPQTMARFDDAKVFPVCADRALETYLINERLRVYVLDENATEAHEALVGSGVVSLGPIASRKPVDAWVDLDCGGVLEVHVVWRDKVGSAVYETATSKSVQEVVFGSLSQQQREDMVLEDYNPMVTPTPTPGIQDQGGHQQPSVPRVQWSSPKPSPRTQQTATPRQGGATPRQSPVNNPTPVASDPVPQPSSAAPLQSAPVRAPSPVPVRAPSPVPARAPSPTPTSVPEASALSVPSIPSIPVAPEPVAQGNSAAPESTSANQASQQSEDDVQVHLDDLGMRIDRDSAILVSVSEIQLDPSFVARENVQSVLIQVLDRSSGLQSLFAMPPDEVTTPPVKLENGKASTYFVRVAELEPRTPARFRANRIMKDPDESNADIVAQVFAVNPDNSDDRRLLGAAEVNLKRILAMRKEVLSEQEAVMDANGISLGCVRMTVIASKALAGFKKAA